jgi:hypothetical protein
MTIKKQTYMVAEKEKNPSSCSHSHWWTTTSAEQDRFETFKTLKKKPMSRFRPQAWHTTKSRLLGAPIVSYHILTL